MILSELGNLVDEQKYRERGEDFDGKISRIAAGLMDNEDHRKQVKEITADLRFLFAGRIQNAVGSARKTTASNCYVSGVIEDDFSDIMDKVKEAGLTMRMGGGIGYDFSTLRPRGDRIASLDSTASGPIAFMGLYDAACATVLSAGHRRGAQMGVLRVDHPDIEEFITAKNNSSTLTNFNVSVGITNEFMVAVTNDLPFDLKFKGKVYRQVSAVNLWDKIMRSTWDWAEPGVLFLDTINQKNNLWYCENIASTNPCAEQPLPPYGACLLGSFNLVKYVKPNSGSMRGRDFDYEQFKADIPPIVRAMDNVIDRSFYPLPQQAEEAKNKRRMGLGVTGLANAAEMLGYRYATLGMRQFTEEVMTVLRDHAYLASVELAKEKGPFPMFRADLYVNRASFTGTLPEYIQREISLHGIRNSHLLSVAPTGTISLMADNVSSGIEPPYSILGERDILFSGGNKRTYETVDYAYQFHGIRGLTADEISAEDHVDILNIVSKYVDSACSKTCNVGSGVSFNEFKDIYLKAWEGGASGCTTFRAAGKRFGMMRNVEEKVEPEGMACYIDPETGMKECA